MIEMIEWVALAIDPDAFHPQEFSGDLVRNVPITAEHRLAQERARFVARAVIGTMREPTQAMCVAGYGTGVIETHPASGNKAAKQVWQAMIDAALK